MVLENLTDKEAIFFSLMFTVDNKDGLNNIAELDDDGPAGIITNNACNPGEEISLCFVFETSISYYFCDHSLI